jgi:hypothetical protein
MPRRIAESRHANIKEISARHTGEWKPVEKLLNGI